MAFGLEPASRSTCPYSTPSDLKRRLALFCGARRAQSVPLQDKTHQLLRRIGRWFASRARIPSPKHQSIMAHMVSDLGQRPVTVGCGVFDLFADFPRTPPRPLHFHGRQDPVWRARWTVENIGVLRAMARCAGQGFRPIPANPSVNIHPMGARTSAAVMGTGPKGNIVLSHVAITAPRMRENRVDLPPQRQASCVGKPCPACNQRPETSEQAKDHAFHALRSNPA